MSHMHTADIVGRLVFDWENVTDRNLRDVFVEVDIADVTVFTWKFEGVYDWYSSGFDEMVIDMGLDAFAHRLREVLQP